MELPAETDPALRAVVREALAEETTGRDLTWARSDDGQSEPVHCLFAPPEAPFKPPEVFDRVRFGGVLVVLFKRWREARRCAGLFDRAGGFEIDQPPATLTLGRNRLGLPDRVHYFVARKVMMLPPGEFSHRFTFTVSLVRHAMSGGEYAVLKEVPSHELVMKRLRSRYKDLDEKTLAHNASQLVDKVFPLMLTRESGFLRLLEEQLPAGYRERVPKLFGVMRRPDGFVNKMLIKWFRQGGEPISPLEFARESTTLLKLIHEVPRVVHLDMRLDNFLITPEGVCLLDFASSVQLEEDFSESAILQTLFKGWLETSGVQQVMGQMIRKGQLTSAPLVAAHKKVDVAADIFYLALQLPQLHRHHDFGGLLEGEAESEANQALKNLREEVLRPADPQQPTITTARDLLNAIERIEIMLEDDRIPLE